MYQIQKISVYILQTLKIEQKIAKASLVYSTKPRLQPGGLVSHFSLVPGPSPLERHDMTLRHKKRHSSHEPECNHLPYRSMLRNKSKSSRHSNFLRSISRDSISQELLVFRSPDLHPFAPFVQPARSIARARSLLRCCWESSLGLLKNVFRDRHGTTFQGLGHWSSLLLELGSQFRPLRLRGTQIGEQ